ncbi:FHA domain-containing protein [Brooklawnia sp.]|uniref:FHA domain-containing protein n=1 Tax=Brooklawnia sp. TaxID=2699740 RepID=UPI00311F2C38
MARCAAGHQSLTDDYCSVCGAPIDAAATPVRPARGQPGVLGQVLPPGPAVPPTRQGNQTCPVCHSVAAAGAFFCETCGYDFLTGALPRGFEAQADVQPTVEPESAASAKPSSAEPPAPQAAVAPSYFDLGEAPGHAETKSPLVVDSAASVVPHPAAPDLAVAAALDLGDPGPDLPDPDSLRAISVPPRIAQGTYQPQPSQGSAPALRASSASPGFAPTRAGSTARWVAEIWIDPEWYRMQQAPEQLPSPGQPIIEALRVPRVVVGRTSGDAHPDIDCRTDTGVSRRQAALTTDGVRWFVEDLGSSNGTYVGRIDQPLPIEPITRRVELGHHDRIYVGSWTRIVVRPALVQEADL